MKRTIPLYQDEVMTRKIAAALAIVLTGGVVVAVVRAQESTPGVYSQQRSVLKRPQADAIPSGEQVGTGLRDRGSSGRLVDRLKQIRGANEGTVQEPSSLAPPRRVVDGAGRSSMSVGDGSGGEPKLLTDRAPSGSRYGATPPTNPGIAPRRMLSERLSDRSASSRRVRPRDDQSTPNSSGGGSAFRGPQTTPGFRSSDTDSAFRAPDRTAPVEPPVNRTFVESSGSAVPEREMPVQGVLLHSEGPALEVNTTGPQAIVVGQEAEFQLTLTNRSRIPAHDVFVRVALPTWVEIAGADDTAGDTQVQGADRGAQELIWRVTQFAGGGQEVLSLKVIPRENRSFNLAVDWTLRPTSAAAQIQVQQPELQMAVLGPENIQFGQTAVYTIRLSNPGTGDAQNVRLDFGYGPEHLPTNQIGTLAAGEQLEIPVELSARQAGALRIEATATAAGGLSAEQIEEVWVRRAKLEVVVRGAPVKFAGGVATYEIRVRNVGDASADGVLTEVMLPPGAKLVNREGLTGSGKTVIKELGSISPNAEGTFRLQCQLTNPGENRVQANARGGGNLSATNTFVTSVRTIADLKLSVNDPPGPIAIGESTTYELKVVNRGTKAAQQVQIIAQFSSGIDPIDASGISARLSEDGQVLFQPISRIEPGEEIRLRITARANVEGTHRFRAKVECAEIDTVLVEEETTYFFGDDLSTAGNSGGLSR